MMLLSRRVVHRPMADTTTACLDCGQPMAPTDTRCDRCGSRQAAAPDLWAMALEELDRS